MDPKTAKLVREWKAGYDEANRVDLEEARNRTPEERFKNLHRFRSGLSSMGLLRERSDDLEYHVRWLTLREKWLARNP